MPKNIDLKLVLALAWLILGRIVFEIYKSSVLTKSVALTLN
jgi:hypothetical protein